MNRYEEIQSKIRRAPKVWLITGVAGFIGSNLLEKLLQLDQKVVGLDNFSTGKRRNLSQVRSRVSSKQWGRFHFAKRDICRLDACKRACEKVDYVLHHAALGSVPRSLKEPLRSHASNVNGFLNMLIAARDAEVSRFVYASSSSVYGDHSKLPKQEAAIGRPLSPYASTKLIDEIYAYTFHRCYGLPSTGLRYFNVFGPRQDPDGAYAAVIPKWFSANLEGKPLYINGDGKTSRDFCYIENVVQANLLAATVDRKIAPGEIYNVALGQRTTLRELSVKIRDVLAAKGHPAAGDVIHKPERAGDVRHSLADIQKIRDSLGYRPTHTIDAGLAVCSEWYINVRPRERV